MWSISDKAFVYLNGLNIMEYSNLSEYAYKNVIRKEAKARGFHKKQRWNKSLLAGEKCGFNTIICELKGHIMLKDELEQPKDGTVYFDPKLNIAIAFDQQNEINLAKRKCRNNVKIRIARNKEIVFKKSLNGFVRTGNYKVLLIATQNISKDEELFLSPMDFKRYNGEKDACSCAKEDYCLYPTAK
ncbi:histone-lysine N-methyltransferase [Trachipleistophora hominis]|uniref:Histone-lysine N-methyltransferase n=1 Tax=Trachipleistophora hominis TaxID=72359 RepID=L7JVR5_TRAHO|nr:histone-lysine N-methyltransferase [Trachipleistophora hominis]